MIKLYHESEADETKIRAMQICLTPTMLSEVEAYKARHKFRSMSELGSHALLKLMRGEESNAMMGQQIPTIEDIQRRLEEQLNAVSKAGPQQIQNQISEFRALMLDFNNLFMNADRLLAMFPADRMEGQNPQFTEALNALREPVERLRPKKDFF